MNADIEEFIQSKFIGLFEGVFSPTPDDKVLLVLADFSETLFTEADSQRLQGASAWAMELIRKYPDKVVKLILYPRVATNGAPLPEEGFELKGAQLPETLQEIREKGRKIQIEAELKNADILLTASSLSATHPLFKLQESGAIHARGLSTRGIFPEMIPSLSVSFDEVYDRTEELRKLLDEAQGATIEFQVEGALAPYRLDVDLRYRKGKVESRLDRQLVNGRLPTTRLNLSNIPIGEAFKVPYEGEREGEPSRTEGILPVQFGDEVVLYQFKNNRAIAVLSSGPKSEEEAKKIAEEPAYGNLAEFGLGILQDFFGVGPIRADHPAAVVHNEKLRPHLAFGMSDHFDGVIGERQFRRRENVVHIDRIYSSKMQPKITLTTIDLQLKDGSSIRVMENGTYRREIFERK